MISKIEKKGFCLGCGLCSSALGKDKCEMLMSEDGFYHPKVKAVLSKNENQYVKALCPAIHIESLPHKGVWGNVRFIAEAWSADNQIRFKAASGGTTTSLAIYLLENNLVDAVLQVGVSCDSALFNELKISRTRDDVIKNAQSRYAPTPIFQNLIDILESSKESYAFIGKPCDIAALKNLCAKNDKYLNRIKYFLSIFCAGMPSYNATKQVYQQSGRSEEPISIQYRGNGWPGFFRAVWKDGYEFKMSYNDSWGKFLGRKVGMRCKICPDGIGMLADIAIGDSWNTSNGYPDFTEAEGKCFCMIRSVEGEKIFKDAIKKGYLIGDEVPLNKIQFMQAYQYGRRKMIGWRLLPIYLLSGFMFSFKGLGIISLTIHSNFIKGIKNAIGSLKRYMEY